jgi:lysozyme
MVLVRLVLFLAACSQSGGPDPMVRTPPTTDDTGLPDTDADADTDADSDADADTDTDTDTDTEPIDTGDGEGPLYGVDVSGWQPGIDWDPVWDDGVDFAYMKATEGTYYTNDEFPDQYNGSADVGMVRGAYHFAIPDDSDGASQAAFFVDNGGGWTADGRTLPGALDIEYNPYGETCYNLSESEMAQWIDDFNEEYLSLTGRYPSVYTTANWWDTCVGSDGGDNPLWIAQWGSSEPTLPGGWDEYVFWQFSASEEVDGIDGDVDMNLFPGNRWELEQFADNQAY